MKPTKTERARVPPVVDEYSMVSFDEAMKAGLERHPKTWYASVRAATNVMRGHGFHSTDPLIDAMVAEILLRVLDVVRTD